MPPPNVFTIAAGLPFVDVLAAGIRTRTGDDPAALAGVTVLVPTQRSRRVLTEAFLRQSGGQALLLPRIIALGDMDEDEIQFSGGFDDVLRVPEAASGLERQLLLTRLVLARDDVSPDQAANLGLELARLLDQVHTERLSFKDLKNLAPDEFAEHWRETLEFLTILTELWPGILKDNNTIDAAERRNLLFDAQGQAWAANPPPGPVIAAGSTGSIPATADLLAVIAQMTDGAVVLPGLDVDATEEAWAALEDHHPQFGMARLLVHFGITRDDVHNWESLDFKTEPSARGRLIHAALTPAGVDAPSWSDKKEIEMALDGIARVDCPTPREEAVVIALIMRETLETPEKTCALVTPDRGLARRVAAELARWNIGVDDSAGVPLAQTLPGAFLRLTARMVADDLAPVSLLAALKHPLAAGGFKTATLRAKVRALETTLLRGPRPAPGIQGLLRADKIHPETEAFLASLQTLIEPFAKVLNEAAGNFSDILMAHVQMAEALAATDEENGAQRLWAGDAGEAAMTFVVELNNAAKDFDGVSGADYPALLDTLM
ncbi:MAG: double-strand break repair protein AddB, partial [Alphaproteobacteria bacterium]|nr:double-strand break repair protein AddB [Alphaproteobacteria bacterium]